MKLKYLLVIAVIHCLGSLSAQTYSAQNFTLQSLTDPEAGTGFKYSACWGWTQPETGNEYAIACSKNGTYWVDVTNPYSPTVCAYKAGTSSNGTWREVKTYKNFCYVVCDDGSSTGFQIFDMSTLPATVTLVSSNQTLFRRGHAAWVDGNKLYVSGVTYSTGSSPSSSSMDVYSLATPTAPVLLRRLSQDYSFINYVHDAFVRNDTVFASCGYQGLYVFKFDTITNTFNQLGSLTSYTASGYNHSSALTPDGQTLVFMDEVPASLPIKVANVSNLSNIQVLATINQFPQTTPHNPFVVNNQYAFVAAYRDGTQLFDISNPSAPFLAGYFDTHPQKGGNNNIWSGSAYDGQWGCYPFFASRNIFALDEQNGIFMLNTHLYSVPDIAVQGNANDISDGTSVTSPTNNTNYSTVNVGSSVAHTFEIQNTGLAVLNVSTITITGANAGDFSLVAPPAFPFTVAPSASISISVQFSPTAAGTRSALVTIDNDDYNELLFDFVIDGDGNIATRINKSGADANFSIFPNPAKNEIELNLPSNINDKELQLKIYDATGKLVAEKTNTDMPKLNKGSRKVNLSGLDNGLYIIDLISENQTIVSERLVISK